MKYLFFLLVTTPFVFSKNLPLMDPGQPVYQAGKTMPDFLLKVHPSIKEVKPLSAKELQVQWEAEFTRENRRKMWNRGFMFLQIGIVMTLTGFILSRMLAQYLGQMLAHMISPVGIVFACSGAWLMEAAEKYWIIGFGVLIMALYITYSVLTKDKGISIKSPFRKTKSNYEEAMDTIEDFANNR
jgi:hypothetical protein